MMKRVSRKSHFELTVSRFNEFQMALSNAFLLFLVLLTVEQVFARYFFDASSVALQELQLHLFAAVVLLSLAKCLACDSHVRVDLFYSTFSDKIKRRIDFAGTLLALIPLSMALIWYGGLYALDSMSYVNPRAHDFYSSSLFTNGSLPYKLASGLEGMVRKHLLFGEISPNPGGLEGKFWAKTLIPLSGIMLFLQGLADILLFFQKKRGS